MVDVYNHYIRVVNILTFIYNCSRRSYCHFFVATVFALIKYKVALCFLVADRNVKHTSRRDDGLSLD